MDKSHNIILNRNILMAVLTTIFYLLSIGVNLFFDPTILTIIGPLGFLTCGIIILLTIKRIVPRFTMYFIITVIYLFFFILISYEPILVNYIFLWLCLLLSAVYYKVAPILYASTLTIALSIYFFFTNRESIFVATDTVDLVYICLFTIFITLFLVFTSIFTERLRMKAEQGEDAAIKELLEIKGYLESLFNHMTDAVVIHDLEGNVIKVNKTFQTIYKWDESEVEGKRIPFINEVDFEYIRKKWRVVYEQGIGMEEIQMKHVTRDGNMVDVSISISPIRDTLGATVALATFSKDISEKLQTEEIMRRSEKLSVVGQLAAGVAHEIRNPLTVISGFLQLQQETEKNNPHNDLMLSELNRINKIISEFLVLSKPQLENYEDVEITSIIKEVATLINTSAIMKNISVNTNFLTEDFSVHCEPNQIKQVLINLLRNSIEAMEYGGVITVTVEPWKKRNLRIKIIDQGIGIPNGILSKLGEPFLTTKENGTGLGLMISFKIIEDHKGKIAFTSEEMKGTTVEIILPGK